MQLQALIPVWRFFDDPGSNPKTYFKSEAAGEWQEVFLPSPRKWWHLFFNPEGNLGLLEVSAFDRLLDESQEVAAATESLSKSVSYGVCLKIMETRLKSRVGPGESFRFKICAQLTDGEVRQDVFVSGVHHFEF